MTRHTTLAHPFFPGTMIALLSFALLAAAPDSTQDAERLEQARQALVAYAAPHDITVDAERWEFAWADLNGDGLKDALALSRDANWCGSGGCTLLVLETIPAEDQEELGPFRVAAEIAMVNETVQVLEKHTHGWADLAVTARDGTTTRLSFDGETYPFSPAEGVLQTVNSGTVLFAAGE